MKETLLGKVFRQFKNAKTKMDNTDWSNPKNALLLLLCIILPFVAWYYISTGFVIGLLMSVSILWLLEKSPYFIKYLVSKFPFVADLVLSSLVIIMFGGYFGSGLTLGIGAICTAIILSWGLQAFAERFERDKRTNEKVHAS